MKIKKIVLLYLLVTVYAFSIAQNIISNVPSWLIKPDTNLQWIKEKQKTDIQKKTAILKQLSLIDKSNIRSFIKNYNYSYDSLAKLSFLVDVNHDNINDLILYDFLPFCDSQPYIMIAVSKNYKFEIILQRECDFISWQSKVDTITFQLYIQGCCSDQFGYIYTVSSIKGDENNFNSEFEKIKHHTLFTNDNPIIFWYFPIYNTINIQLVNEIEFIKDSIMLRSIPERMDSFYESYIQSQYRFIFFAGDCGEILSEKTVNDKKWYYLKMPINKRNMPDDFKQGSYFYGWTSENNVRIK